MMDLGFVNVQCLVAARFIAPYAKLLYLLGRDSNPALVVRRIWKSALREKTIQFIANI